MASGTIKADICVIGAGSGGLAVAAGAAQMGARTVLFEKGKMGGDCLNYGCVPSKALLAAGNAAAGFGRARHFGVNGANPQVTFPQVHDHVQGVIGTIAPHDSVERYEGFGVTVLTQPARFSGPSEVVAEDGTRVTSRRFVVATGSSPGVPPIPGLDTVPFMTNETVFDQTELPRHLIIIGGGPIGIEMAQAHRRLGAQVTVLEMFSALAHDDPDLAEVVKDRLREEGVVLREGIAIDRIEALGNGDGIAVVLKTDEEEERVEGTHLLVAAGRRPNLSGLDLEAAGIEYTPKGITVDARLRSSNKRVFAVGDIAGGYQFTHIAGYHAGIVIRNALFRLPAKVDYRAVPWVTYTDPELANVGLTEKAAREKHGDTIRVVTTPFSENDRAQAERETVGMVKVVTDKKGRILGAGLVGYHAGELLQPWVLAISQGLKISAMASIIAPYPTMGEVNKRVAGAYYTPALFSNRTRRLVRLLGLFG